MRLLLTFMVRLLLFPSRCAFLNDLTFLPIKHLASLFGSWFPATCHSKTLTAPWPVLKLQRASGQRSRIRARSLGPT